MNTASLSKGTGRLKVEISAQWIGEDLVACISNKGGHLGAVAVADYSREENRASTSVITRLGHKDDAVACSAAYKLCRQLKRPVCVIAGIHLAHITGEEIAAIVRNCDELVDSLIQQLSVGSR